MMSITSASRPADEMSPVEIRNKLFSLGLKLDSAAIRKLSVEITKAMHAGHAGSERLEGLLAEAMTLLSPPQRRPDLPRFEAFARA